MIPPQVRAGGNRMDDWKLGDAASNAAKAIDEWSRAVAEIYDELAERGRFDEDGGYLSDEDWADSQ